MQEHDCFPHSHISTSTVCKRSSVQRPRQCSSTWPEVPQPPNGDQTARDRSRTKTITLATAILRSRLAQDLLFFRAKTIVVQRCVVASEALTLDRRWLSAELSAAKPLSSALLNSQHIDLG